MMTFRPSRSLTRGVPIVEVWWGDKFIATICPPPPGSEAVAFSVVSKYLDDIVVDHSSAPPVIAVVFDLGD